MILVEAGAGLGNQLFQYAFARYVQRKTARPVFIVKGGAPEPLRSLKLIMKFVLRGDVNSLRQLKHPAFFRYFALDQFAIPLRIIPGWQAELLIQGSKLTRIFLPSSALHTVHKGEELPFAEHVVYDKKHVHYRGCWWHAAMVNHVHDLLVEELQFVSLPSNKSQELTAKIKATPNAVALHLRCGWGDGNYDTTDKGQRMYTGVDGFRSLSADYYAKAIPLAENKLTKPTFFVFTDNLEKARALLAGLPQRSAFVYVDPAGRMPWEDLYLMQHCAHFILSNSTFAWWGAWLMLARGSEKTPLIIMPDDWFPGDLNLSQRLQMTDDTIRIPNTFLGEPSAVPNR